MWLRDSGRVLWPHSRACIYDRSRQRTVLMSIGIRTRRSSRAERTRQTYSDWRTLGEILWTCLAGIDGANAYSIPITKTNDTCLFWLDHCQNKLPLQGFTIPSTTRRAWPSNNCTSFQAALYLPVKEHGRSRRQLDRHKIRFAIRMTVAGVGKVESPVIVGPHRPDDLRAEDHVQYARVWR